MPRATCNAVYNSLIPVMLIPPPRSQHAATRLVIAFLFLHAFFVSQGHAWADNWTGPEEQLAAKIAAVTGPGAMAVDFSNRSSLRQADVDEIRRGLLIQLAALGVRFVNAEQAAATVRVFLSQDLRDYVWVAEIHQGTNEPAIVMVSLPRPETQPAGHEEAAMTIRKTLLWSQADRILDVAVLDGQPAHMVVLDSNGVTVYKLQDSRWQAEQTLAVAHSRPWPRDLRGRLVLRKDHLFDAYLPGVFCRSTGAGSLAINCYDSDDPWPLGTDQFSLNGFFTPARNYFTGALAPGVGKQTTTTAFYSAAALPREKYALWLFAAVDGQVHLLDGITDQVAGKLGWGSDIAGVHTGCGSGWQVLATASGDTGSDTVRAFEVLDREPIAMSPPAESGGAITALWAESSGTSAIAVSRNSETGRYEAFRLTITCGH
jgi:hypothetical protein